MRTARGEAGYECVCGLVGEIEAGDAGALQGEVLDGCRADALSASGDEDGFVGEAGITGKGVLRFRGRHVS